MASIRFGGLVLGIIIVSLALKYSSACAQEGGERKGKWLPSIASKNHASSSNDLQGDRSMAKIAGRKVLRGRHMQKDELMKREIENKEGSNEVPEISGKDASQKSSEGASHTHKDNGKVDEQKENASKNPSSTSSEATVFEEHDDDNDVQNEDSKEVVEAADEVVNLMRKDYRGMDRPRRKPPINNHKPTD